MQENKGGTTVPREKRAYTKRAQMSTNTKRSYNTRTKESTEEAKQRIIDMHQWSEIMNNNLDKWSPNLIKKALTVMKKITNGK